MTVINRILMSMNSESFLFDGKTRLYKSDWLNKVRLYAYKLWHCVDTDRIAFVATESVWTIILMLASMYIGKAFCPIDKDFSCSKMKQIVDETNATYVFTNETKTYELHKLFRKAINIDSDACLSEDPTNDNYIYDRQANNNEIYIIYTSGTTGRSKGSIISNDSLYNYCESICKVTKLSSHDISLVNTSMAFDLAYTAIFPILFAGGSVCIFNDIVYNSSDLIDFIETNKITFIKTTPSILKMISRLKWVNKNILLRCILSGGENFDYDSCSRLYEMFMRRCDFYNHYGPTEATIGCCIGMVSFDNKKQDATQMYPIENVSISIINEAGKKCLPREVGELIISGICLGKYMTCKSGLDENKYSTGDLAYFTDDGGITIVGRKNNVVKINGYRVNTDYITRCVREINGIDDAVCTYDSEGRLHICFYVSKVKDKIDIEYELKKYLSVYEIPQVFFRCNKIPRTSNGKVDIGKLLNRYKKVYQSCSYRGMIERATGERYDVIKDKRIKEYLSSIEYIELLSQLSNMTSVDLFSSCASFVGFSDLLHGIEMNRVGLQCRIEAGFIVLISGGDSEYVGVNQELQSLSIVISNIDSKIYNRVLLFTLHSSTPSQYSKVLRGVFEKQHFKVDMLGADDMLYEVDISRRIKNSNIIYISGGSYLHLIYEFEVLKKYINFECTKDKILIGVCSGAGIFCKEFYTDNYEYDLRTDKRFEFHNGNGMLNISLSPHFSSDPQRSLLLLDDLKKRDYKNVLALDDGMVICFDENKQYEIMSLARDSRAYLLSSVNGKIYKKILSKNGRLV